MRPHLPESRPGRPVSGPQTARPSGSAHRSAGATPYRDDLGLAHGIDRPACPCCGRASTGLLRRDGRFRRHRTDFDEGWCPGHGRYPVVTMRTAGGVL